MRLLAIFASTVALLGACVNALALPDVEPGSESQPHGGLEPCGYGYSEPGLRGDVTYLKAYHNFGWHGINTIRSAILSNGYTCRFYYNGNCIPSYGSETHSTFQGNLGSKSECWKCSIGTQAASGDEALVIPDIKAHSESQQHDNLDSRDIAAPDSSIDPPKDS
ncbi:hypothetical protein P280DRAFT_478919 [Massarina eburnea CBS 473.64]|uniref:Uncharacterized protein n=1 Tax=Massarina eburnea CBS 473.64 TaxID=1395130 RepID=A0A6A6S4M1_9PLEO|nr:hypothetical protein P280DRAFT_478919 [Massarina eburnea CBS 473.64]